MINTQLIQYLLRFTKSELAEFNDFVCSPYFNKHQKTKDLLAYLLKIKSWDQENLNKQKVFKNIFPKQPYQEQHLSNLISYLLKLLRQFYIQKQSEKSEIDQQINLLEIALQADQKKLFLLTSGKVTKALKQTEILDSTYLFQQNKLLRLQDNYDLKYGKRTSGEYLEKALHFFDAYLVSEKLKMTCQMLARKQVTGREYSFPITNELIIFIEKESKVFSAIPSVWIYYLIYKMITGSNDTFYFQLKSNLKIQAKYFQQQEGRDLYTHALNYCIGRLNLGETSFRKEAFELYQQMLDNGVLHIKGTLPNWDYTNIVSLGSELKEYQWIEKFIFEQKDFLQKNQKENTFRYNLAAFYYSQKSYDKAIELLQQVEFSEVYYNLLTRILLLKIYFDNNNQKALEYSLETFRIFLLRTKKLESNRRKSGLNLIRFTKKLNRIIEEKSITSKKDFFKKTSLIKTQIEEKQKVLNRSWLLKKIEELN